MALISDYLFSSDLSEVSLGLSLIAMSSDNLSSDYVKRMDELFAINNVFLKEQVNMLRYTSSLTFIHIVFKTLGCLVQHCNLDTSDSVAHKLLQVIRLGVDVQQEGRLAEQSLRIVSQVSDRIIERTLIRGIEQLPHLANDQAFEFSISLLLSVKDVNASLLTEDFLGLCMHVGETTVTRAVSTIISEKLELSGIMCRIIFHVSEVLPVLGVSILTAMLWKTSGMPFRRSC